MLCVYVRLRDRDTERIDNILRAPYEFINQWHIPSTASFLQRGLQLHLRVAAADIPGRGLTIRRCVAQLQSQTHFGRVETSLIFGHAARKQSLHSLSAGRQPLRPSMAALAWGVEETS
jgi:hypothetical protein